MTTTATGGPHQTGTTTPQSSTEVPIRKVGPPRELSRPKNDEVSQGGDDTLEARGNGHGI